MTAQKKKPPKPVKLIRAPKRGSKSETILTLATTTNARPVEISRLVNCERALVTQVMKRYGINPNTLESFKQHRADIIAGKAEQVLKQLNKATLKNASANNLAYAFTALHNAERLERNLSTANTASVVADIAELKRIDARRKSVDNPVDK